ALGFVAVGALLTGNDHFPVLDGDFFHLKAGIVFQALTDVGPIDRLPGYARRQGTARFRFGIEKLLRPSSGFQVGTESDADHCSIAAFPAGTDINAVSDLEHRTNIETRICYFKIRVA